MTAYVVVEHRGYERTGVGGQMKRVEWWWFFTQPLVYSVYWRSDGSKTLEQYLEEEVAKVRAHIASEGSTWNIDVHGHSPTGTA
jgi:hypothetical protein